MASIKIPFILQRMLVGFSLLGIFFFIMNWLGAIEYDKFYKASISETFVKCDDSQIRTVYYYTNSDIEITTSVMPPNTFDLRIGDSIVKNKRSSIFKLYRKDNVGSYKYLYT
jgi:hypothetical protein